MDLSHLRGKKLGPIFRALGVLDADQEAAALENARKWKVPFGRACVMMGFFADEIVVRGLAIQLGLPLVALSAVDVPEDVRTSVDASLAEKHRVIPVCRIPGKARSLVVALSAPKSSQVVDELSFATGCRIDFVLATDKDIDAALLRLYAIDVEAHSRSPQMVDLAADVEGLEGEALELDVDREGVRHLADFLPVLDLDPKKKV